MPNLRRWPRSWTVFATGDHEDLGVKMNGRVPRVRAMRKWYFPGPGPNGEPGAPPGIGTLRIDTTQPNVPGSPTVLFDNQSDGKGVFLM